MRKPRSSLGTGITPETDKQKGNFGIIDIKMQIDEGRNDTQHNDIQDNDTQHNSK